MNQTVNLWKVSKPTAMQAFHNVANISSRPCDPRLRAKSAMPSRPLCCCETHSRNYDCSAGAAAKWHQGADAAGWYMDLNRAESEK